MDSDSFARDRGNVVGKEDRQETLDTRFTQIGFLDDPIVVFRNLLVDDRWVR